VGRHIFFLEKTYIQLKIALGLMSTQKLHRKPIKAAMCAITTMDTNKMLIKAEEDGNPQMFRNRLYGGIQARFYCKKKHRDDIEDI